MPTNASTRKAKEAKRSCCARFPGAALRGNISTAGQSLTSELTGAHRQGAARRMLPHSAHGALPVRVRVERPVRPLHRSTAGMTAITITMAPTITTRLTRPRFHHASLANASPARDRDAPSKTSKSPTTA